ncbi:MAG: fibronectin type III domain-containing protein, partial [Candidatus Latescibacteria bacterium]|nr:fibronectin type III domain-containing protein [Candidatus Latescibacterota bacterium]
SLVQYDTTTAYSLRAEGADSVTSHRVTLTGLSDSTTYHFRVGSTDPSGNTAWSQDSTFTTLAYREEAETTAIFVVTGTVYRDGAPVEEELNVTVRNLATESELSDLTGRTAGVGGYVVTFSDLAGNRAAAVGDTIEVTVYDAEGSVLGQAMHLVTADEIAASLARIDITLPGEEDTVPPQISEVSVLDITSTSATVTWTTDEPSSSVVEYGTTTAYGLSAAGADSVTSHRVTLTGLSDFTIYHFRVGSTDPSGNTAWSQDSTFTTLAYREEAETTAILVVTGTVYRDGAPVEEELTVTVRNLATGSKLSDLTGRTAGVGGYVVTFSDVAGNRAAAVGDTIEMTVYDAEGSVLGQAMHQVTADEIAASLARIDVTLPAVEELAGDFNKDGWVWTEDFVMFVTQFGRQQGDEGFDPIYDLDQDGWVWTDDFAIFVAQFGKTSGTAKTVAELPPVGKNHNAEVSVSVHTRPTLLSSEDREFTVELSVENAAELRGYGLTLDYDPQVLEFLGATPGKDNLLNRAGGSTPLFLVVSNPDKPGQIWIANALADSKLAQGDGLLASFSFRNRGKLSGSSLPISLSAVKLFDARLHLNSISAESVMRQIQLVPEQNRLAQNYPNPFNAVTSISYQLAQPAFVTLEVYNLSGQLVKTLITDEKPAGWHSARWDGRDSSGGTVASGIYFYHLSAGEFSKVHKMLLLK